MGIYYSRVKTDAFLECLLPLSLNQLLASLLPSPPLEQLPSWSSSSKNIPSSSPVPKPWILLKELSPVKHFTPGWE